VKAKNVAESSKTPSALSPAKRSHLAAFLERKAPLLHASASVFYKERGVEQARLFHACTWMRK
ncbi:hypothetical protein FRC03_005931, partial [Tulasnella sp. 419]